MNNLSKTIMVFILFSLSLSAFSQTSIMDIKNEVVRLEKANPNPYMKSPIVLVVETSDIISASDFKKFLDSNDDNHTLDYSEVYDGSFQAFIKKMTKAYYYEKPSIENLVEMIAEAKEDGVVKDFHYGFVARRIWTDYVYDYYFSVTTKNGSIIFKVYDFQ